MRICKSRETNLSWIFLAIQPVLGQQITQNLCPQNTAYMEVWRVLIWGKQTFFAFIQKISKSLCKFDSELFQPIWGLKLSPGKFWLVVSCCWVPQMRTKPVKNIWGLLLDSINSYYIQCPWKNCQLFTDFLAP